MSADRQVLRKPRHLGGVKGHNKNEISSPGSPAPEGAELHKILIDTSVWIKYFKNKSASFSEKVDDILSKREVYVPKIVIAELIQGSRSEREVSVIEDFVNAFNIIDQKEDTWIKAGKLSFTLKKKGRTVNLSDCYIAVTAQEHGCQIFSLDEHFKEIQKALNVQLIFPDSD
jgi:predicted nucleic acid-binding protein